LLVPVAQRAKAKRLSNPV